MDDISLDITGRGSRYMGLYVGAGLDDAVRFRRARLTRVVTDPPASIGRGIWSDSRVELGDVQVEAMNNRRFGGRALQDREP